MKTTTKTIITTLVLCTAAVSVATLVGCQTVKGAGQDLQNASTATEKAITGESK